MTTSDAKGRMSVHFSSASNEWSTPQDFFDKMNAEFDFTLDVCATEENAKCAAFISPKQDGLATEWRGRCWMNPPYGREIGKWVQRAYLQSHQMRNGILEPAELVVCLVPARTTPRGGTSGRSRLTRFATYAGGSSSKVTKTLRRSQAPY